MVKKPYGQDGIGEWSELKLRYIRQYIGAYTNIMHFGQFKNFYFLDLFSSAGFCKSRSTKLNVDGSPKIALEVDPPFSRYYFFELDYNKINALKSIKENSPLKDRINIVEGDCNEKVSEVLNSIDSGIPFLALLDPQAGDLYWDTIAQISQKLKSEVLINFPLGMAIKRYMPLTEGKNISTVLNNKLDKIFGNHKWHAIYQERKNGVLSSLQANEKYLSLYLDGVISLGYKYYGIKKVKNFKNALLYYLIFATKNRRGLEKMKDILIKNDRERNTLFFHQDWEQKIYKVFAGRENVNLDIILESLLTGTHCYKVQDFKDALKKLEKEGKLCRVNQRKRARSFNENDIFSFV